MLASEAQNSSSPRPEASPTPTSAKAVLMLKSTLDLSQSESHQPSKAMLLSKLKQAILSKVRVKVATEAERTEWTDLPNNKNSSTFTTERILLPTKWKRCAPLFAIEATTSKTLHFAHQFLPRDEISILWKK